MKKKLDKSLPIATLSIGAARFMEFGTSKGSRPSYRQQLLSNSLFVMHPSTQTSYFHRIARGSSSCHLSSHRFSLTFRKLTSCSSSVYSDSATTATTLEQSPSTALDHSTATAPSTALAHSTTFSVTTSPALTCNFPYDSLLKIGGPINTFINDSAKEDNDIKVSEDEGSGSDSSTKDFIDFSPRSFYDLTDPVHLSLLASQSVGEKPINSSSKHERSSTVTDKQKLQSSGQPPATPPDSDSAPHPDSDSAPHPVSDSRTPSAPPPDSDSPTPSAPHPDSDFRTPSAPPPDSDSPTPSAPPPDSDSPTSSAPPPDSDSPTSSAPPPVSDSPTPSAPPPDSDSPTPSAPPPDSDSPTPSAPPSDSDSPTPSAPPPDSDSPTPSVPPPDSDSPTSSAPPPDSDSPTSSAPHPDSDSPTSSAPPPDSDSPTSSAPHPDSDYRTPSAPPSDSDSPTPSAPHPDSDYRTPSAPPPDSDSPTPSAHQTSNRLTGGGGDDTACPSKTSGTSNLTDISRKSSKKRKLDDGAINKETRITDTHDKSIGITEKRLNSQSDGTNKHIGYCYVIDFANYKESKNMASFLTGLGFKVDTCFESLQEGISCGFNAANIIAYLNGLLEKGKSWRRSSVSHLIYGSKKDQNLCELGNVLLGDQSCCKGPRFLNETQCLELVQRYNKHFNYYPGHVKNVGYCHSDGTFKKLIENQVKRKRDLSDKFYIVNTHNGSGKHWYVIAVSFCSRDQLSSYSSTHPASVTAHSTKSTRNDLSSKGSDRTFDLISTDGKLSPPSTPRAHQSCLTPSSSLATQRKTDSSMSNCYSISSSTSSIASSRQSQYFTPPSTPITPKILFTKKARKQVKSDKQPSASRDRLGPSSAPSISPAMLNKKDVFSYNDEKEVGGSISARTLDNSNITTASHEPKLPSVTNKLTLKEMVQKGSEQKKYLPPCLYALRLINIKYGNAYRVNELPKGSTILESLPEFFGSYKAERTNAKSIKRNVINIVSFVRENNDVKVACANEPSPEIVDLHHSTTLDENICPICFEVDQNEVNKSDSISNKSIPLPENQQFESKLFDLLDSCVSSRPEVRGDQIHEYVTKCIVKFFRTRFPDTQFDHDQVHYCEANHDRSTIFQKVKSNLDNFASSMRKCSVTLWYGLGLSQRQVLDVDRLVNCQQRPALNIEEMVNVLPNVEKIGSTSENYSDEHVLDEYLEFVRINGHEPNFFKLGTKHCLEGPRKGKSQSAISKAAMSVVYNGVLNNPQKCLGLMSVIDLCVASHPTRYEAHPLCEPLSIPRFTSLKEANKELQKEIRSGKLDVGEVIMPSVFTSHDITSNRKKEHEVHIRKKSLRKIRQKILNDHHEKGILKEYPDSYYDDLSRQKVLEILEEYNLYYETENDCFTTEALREILKKAERTREIQTWFDHATILNHSMIMYTVHCVFSRRIFKESGHLKGHALQKYVERPVVYMVGISNSTTEEEEKFAPARIPDILDISHNLTTSDGIEFTDVYRFFTGDMQARNVEVSHNRSGDYRMASLAANLSKDQMTFYEMLQLDHRDYASMQQHALEGGFFDNPENIGKSLQDHKDITLAKSRKVDTTLKTKDEILNLLHQNLEGRRGVPMLLKAVPNSLLADMNLTDYEVIYFEGLHDMKDLVGKALKLIPGSVLNVKIPPNADPDTVRDLKSLQNLHLSVSPITNREPNDVSHSKTTKSGETVFKILIDVTHQLQAKFFNEGPCSLCGPLFTLTKKEKCVKCLIVGIYRCLFEIHTFSNSDHTKRNVLRIIRAYHLVYILHLFLDQFQRKFPILQNDLNCFFKSIHFIDLVYYFPLIHELHNTLSFHTGRQESMFGKLKRICLNNSNRHVYDDSLTLQMLIRLECQNNFQEEKFKHFSTQSVTSKKVTALLEKFPYQKIVLTKAFLQDARTFYRKNLLEHLGRLSNFIVSNDFDCTANKHSYFSVDENDSLVFELPACTCDSVRCYVCNVVKLPPFNISNTLTSSVSNLLKKKKEITLSDEYKSFIARFVTNPHRKKTSTFSGSSTSRQILKSVTIDRKNAAHERLVPTLKSVFTTLDQCSNFKDDEEKVEADTFYDKIQHSTLLKCIAKVLGFHETGFNDEREKILKADGKEGRRMKRLAMRSNDKKKDDMIEFSLHKDFVVTLNSFTPSLKTRVRSIDADLEELCQIYDRLLLNDDLEQEEREDGMLDGSFKGQTVTFSGQFSGYDLKKSIITLQTRKLACLKILASVEEICNICGYFLINYSD